MNKQLDRKTNTLLYYVYFINSENALYMFKTDYAAH